MERPNRKRGRIGSASCQERSALLVWASVTWAISLPHPQNIRRDMADDGEFVACWGAESCSDFTWHGSDGKTEQKQRLDR